MIGLQGTPKMKDSFGECAWGTESYSKLNLPLRRLNVPAKYIELLWADPDEQYDKDRGPRLVKKVWHNIGMILAEGCVPVCSIERMLFSAYAVDGKIYGKTEFQYNTRIDGIEYHTVPGCIEIPCGAPSFRVEILTIDRGSNVTLYYSCHALSGEKGLDLGLREIKNYKALNCASLLRFIMTQSVWTCL